MQEQNGVSLGASDPKLINTVSKIALVRIFFNDLIEFSVEESFIYSIFLFIYSIDRSKNSLLYSLGNGQVQ